MWKGEGAVPWRTFELEHMPTCPGVPTNPIQESQGTWSPHLQSHWVPLLPQYRCKRHSCTADCPTHRRHFPPSQRFQAAVTTQCYSQCYTKRIKTRQQRVHTTLTCPLSNMDDSNIGTFSRRYILKMCLGKFISTIQ